MGIRCWFKALGAVKLFCFVRLLCRNKYYLLLVTAPQCSGVHRMCPVTSICLCPSRHRVSQCNFILAIKKQHYFL